MSPILSLFLWPFAATVLIVIIHAYLGLHVVERGVIFVDLSLAQVAALGATVASLAGFELHSTMAYVFSLAFAFLGAAVFSLTRSDAHRVPQEAIIGIVYAVSAAAAVLVLNRSPEGAEHIKDILVGNLLAVNAKDVERIALLYAGVGVLHWFWRKPLFLISRHPEEAVRRGLSMRLWDFLFYVTFGVVVTNSVGVVGVLLVFSYLIVPSVAAMLLAERVRSRLLIAWAMGLVMSVAGLWASYAIDAPPGATIVCLLGLGLGLVAIVRPLLVRRAA